MKTAFQIFAASLLSAALLFPLPAKAGAKLPLEAFASLPTIATVSLSPDGQHAALMANKEGITTILVQNLEHPERQPSVILSTDNNQYTYNWLRWVNDERLVVSMAFPSKRGHGYIGGVNTTETRMLSVRKDGSGLVNLFKPHSFKGMYQAQFQDNVIDWEPDHGKHILVQISDQERISEPAVFSVDVETGARSQIHASRSNFRSWLVDRNHRVRVGVHHENSKVEIHACDPDGQNWRKLWTYQLLSQESVQPLGFGKDSNLLYILAEHQGHTALQTVDLRDPELKRSLKLNLEGLDLSGSLVYSAKTADVVGFRGTAKTGKASVNYWDSNFRELVGLIDEGLPERHNFLRSMSSDETRYIVYSSNAHTAGEYYLGDDKKNSLSLFASAYPQLPAAAMAKKKFIKIKARDGLELPAYLSLPPGKKANNLPAVLLVHGGPQGHDDASFDTWTQFLANRGYAVLQVNFRGSTGHGGKLMAAGLQRWGMEMQDDLTDAAQWLVANGTADAGRMCIVGASYGGYAALMGVAKTPDLYRCAVSFAGVTDLLELGLDKANYINGKEAFNIQIGSVDKEKQRLQATSPRYLANQIKAPVLLIHGTHDRSVDFTQGEMMDAALNAAGKPHRFISQEKGDHHLSIYEHRLQFFKELENFLAQNLGSAAPAPASN